MRNSSRCCSVGADITDDCGILLMVLVGHGHRVPYAGHVHANRTGHTSQHHPGSSRRHCFPGWSGHGVTFNKTNENVWSEHMHLSRVFFRTISYTTSPGERRLPLK